MAVVVDVAIVVYYQQSVDDDATSKSYQQAFDIDALQAYASCWGCAKILGYADGD